MPIPSDLPPGVSPLDEHIAGEEPPDSELTDPLNDLIRRELNGEESAVVLDRGHRSAVDLNYDTVMFAEAHGWDSLTDLERLFKDLDSSNGDVANEAAQVVSELADGAVDHINDVLDEDLAVYFDNNSLFCMLLTEKENRNEV